MQAAAGVGPRETTEALTELREHHPDCTAIDLLSLDALFLNKQFEAARQAIDRLDERLGGDAYLSVLRCNAYLAEQDYAQASESIQRAIDDEPSLTDAYFVQIGIRLHEKDFAGLCRTFDAMEASTRALMGDMSKLPAYREFVQSEVYKTWNAQRQAKEAAELAKAKAAAELAQTKRAGAK